MDSYWLIFHIVLGVVFLIPILGMIDTAFFYKRRLSKKLDKEYK